MATTDTMAWALCPVFLAVEDCDIPEIMHGPRPICRRCPYNGDGPTNGCRVIAEVAACIALELKDG